MREGPAPERRNSLSSRAGHTDRWIALGLTVFALAYGLMATTFSTGLLADPVGPRAFPLLLAAAMVGCAMVLGLRPGERTRQEWPSRSTVVHGALLSLLLVAYGYLLEPLGYLIATAAMMIGVCLLFGGPFRRSVLSSTVMVIALYLLFSVALDLYLPAIPSF